MSSLPIIQAPDDTITAAARRAYIQYGKQHRQMGMKFPAWDELAINIKANWKAIVASAFGKTEIVNINRMNRDPHSILITGFTKDAAETFRQGIESKLLPPSEPVKGPDDANDDPAVDSDDPDPSDSGDDANGRAPFD